MASRSKKKQNFVKEQIHAGKRQGKRKIGFTFNVFAIIKLILLLLLPLSYFFYSPLLFFILLGFVGTFIVAYKTQHNENAGVLKVYRINILKIDAALALIVICLAVATSLSSATNQTKGQYLSNMSSTDSVQNERMESMQSRMKWMQFKQELQNFLSLQTGYRNAFQSESTGKFTTGELSEDFEKRENIGGRRENRKLEVDDLPIEYLTSSILSATNTILIWSVFGTGLLSLVLIVTKKRKNEKDKGREIKDFEIKWATDEEIAKILDFGDYDDEPSNQSATKQISTESIDTPITDEEISNTDTHIVIDDQENNIETTTD